MARTTTEPEGVINTSARIPRRTAERPTITDVEIAHRAYDLYLARGCEHGHDVEDWLQAERELNGSIPV